jgi:ABC-2 type transport system ATP-binding protein
MFMDSYAIEVRDVTKKFGDFVALDNVSLNAKKGKITGLLGPNGAGKTTLIKAMATLYKIDDGLITIDQVDVTKNPNKVRKLIGLAGQFAAVDDFLTGRETLEMVAKFYGMDKKQSKIRASEILKRLGLERAADKQAKTYSGGMRRRLDLGASLVATPSVLFLDEPTTGLDPRTRMDLWKLIAIISPDSTTTVGI